MTCLRCNGFTVHEQFTDHFDMSCFDGWRCVNCGSILDPVIIANREKQLTSDIHNYSLHSVEGTDLVLEEMLKDEENHPQHNGFSYAK